MKNYDKHLEDLRELYIKATPSQRLKVALDRMNFPECGPNKLIQAVSAVEGLSRALLLNAKVTGGESIDLAYNEIRRYNAKRLVKEYICRYHGSNPTDFISNDVWITFCHAIKYRNLLIHECTFLRHNYSKQLVDASLIVFKKLSEFSKHNKKSQ